MEPLIQFESASASGALLKAYDARTDRWAFPQTGDFWDAVRAAHARGHRGAGVRIAIIDTACDMRIPLLARATGGSAKISGAPFEPDEHGTAVALLAATVAPEATLDIYAVSRGGKPDARLIVDALERIADSPADIVCMSLAMAQDYNFDALKSWIDAHQDLGYGAILATMTEQGGMPKHEINVCRSRVCLCAAVNRLHGSGKRVVAAVGNTAGRAFCPASAVGAIAVGFQLDRRDVIEKKWEVAYAVDPEFSQSGLSDFTLMQPPGALGSSFASPLLAGALALGVNGDDLRRLLVCGRIGAIGDSLMSNWYSHLSSSGEPDQALKDKLIQTYGAAIRAHPHYPNLAPANILGSAIFTASFMINAGLFFMTIGDLSLAKDLLTWCRSVAPDNCHAAANLGKTLFLSALQNADHTQRESLLLAERASVQYADALRTRPDFDPYVNEKRSIDEFIAQLRMRIAQQDRPE